MKQTSVEINETFTELYQFDKERRLFINMTCNKITKKEQNNY
jgi:hypothetical protein